MANCQDLVNAVTALDATLQNILAELQEARAVQTDIRQNTQNVVKVLNDRLPNRTLWDSFFVQITEGLFYAGDTVAERIAQHTQSKTGKAEMPESNVEDIPILDTTIDVDTPGVL